MEWLMPEVYKSFVSIRSEGNVKAELEYSNGI